MRPTTYRAILRVRLQNTVEALGLWPQRVGCNSQQCPHAYALVNKACRAGLRVSNVNAHGRAIQIQKRRVLAGRQLLLTNRSEAETPTPAYHVAHQYSRAHARRRIGTEHLTAVSPCLQQLCSAVQA